MHVYTIIQSWLFYINRTAKFIIFVVAIMWRSHFHASCGKSLLDLNKYTFQPLKGVLLLFLKFWCGYYMLIETWHTKTLTLTLVIVAAIKKIFWLKQLWPDLWKPNIKRSNDKSPKYHFNCLLKKRLKMFHCSKINYTWVMAVCLRYIKMIVCNQIFLH